MRGTAHKCLQVLASMKINSHGVSILVYSLNRCSFEGWIIFLWFVNTWKKSFLGRTLSCELLNCLGFLTKAVSKVENPVFQVRGEIPGSSGQNSKNERISYVRICFTIPKKVGPVEKY